MASPCFWGKLQNLVRFHALKSPCLWGKLHNLSLCFSAGVAVSMGEAAKPRSSVAVSMGEAAKLASLLVLWRRLVYGESCKTSFVFMRSRRRVYGGSCITSVSVSLLASPCLWGKLRSFRLCLQNSECVRRHAKCTAKMMCARGHTKKRHNCGRRHAKMCPSTCQNDACARRHAKNDVNAAVDMQKRRAAMAKFYIAGSFLYCGAFFLHVDAWYPKAPQLRRIFRT